MAALALNAAGHLSNHADVCGARSVGISFAISNTIVSCARGGVFTHNTNTQATILGLVVGPFTAALVVESAGRWWPAYVLAALLNASAACAYVSYAHVHQLIA